MLIVFGIWIWFYLLKIGLIFRGLGFCVEGWYKILKGRKEIMINEDVRRIGKYSSRIYFDILVICYLLKLVIVLVIRV